jgi:hypothetical protein
VNVQRTLRLYVNRYGPVRAWDAVRECLPPGATAREREIAYAALAVDAREGRLDRLDRGLYDRRILND